MPDFEEIARVDEIPPDGRKSVIIDETPALLLRVGDDFYAIEDVCTHDGGPLDQGELEGACVVCPRHGATFDVRSGDPTMPAVMPVATFPVDVRGDDVYVDL